MKISKGCKTGITGVLILAATQGCAYRSVDIKNIEALPDGSGRYLRLDGEQVFSSDPRLPSWYVTRAKADPNDPKRFGEGKECIICGTKTGFGFDGTECRTASWRDKNKDEIMVLTECTKPPEPTPVDNKNYGQDKTSFYPNLTQ